MGDRERLYTVRRSGEGFRDMETGLTLAEVLELVKDGGRFSVVDEGRTIPARRLRAMQEKKEIVEREIGSVWVSDVVTIRENAPVAASLTEFASFDCSCGWQAWVGATEANRGEFEAVARAHVDAHRIGVEH